MPDKPMPGMVMDVTETYAVARESEIEQEEAKVVASPVAFTEKVEKVKVKEDG